MCRTRCFHYMGRGAVAYTVRQPDRVLPDGSIVEGVELAAVGSILCVRHRWHRGDHRAAAVAQ